MRKRYVDTAFGQVHLREAGSGGRALLLIHWTPLSGRMYEAVAPFFVDPGYQVLAPDLLGYGRSDARPAEWSIAAWADNLAEMLDGLGVARADVLGGHNGASVAVELALRHGARVEALVLDGCPLLTDELRAAFRSLAAAPRPTAEAAPRLAFDRTVGLLKEYMPGFEVDDRTIERVWPAMIDYLSTDFVSSGPVAGAYDLAARLPLVRHSTLLLGAEHDTLASSFAEATRLLRPMAQHMFAGHHPIHFPARAAEYAGVVTRFLATVPAPPD
jgi:pimeloyl-ACP methyl ester carboxylesterase